MITDWSSIADDFLIKSPRIVFLDREIPFEYGVNEEYGKRYSKIIKNIEEVDYNLFSGMNYDSEKIARLKRVFGSTLDGKCCERYDKEIKELMK